MSSAHIREAIEKAARTIAEQPERARISNPPATASLVAGLKCRVTGTKGEATETDMPVGVGGGASAPNPGWFMRAALASCNATCIAMRAAKRGIELASLEVTVSSETDNRGLLGIDDGVFAGMRNLRVHVRISAPGTPERELSALVHEACSHSPVGCTDATSAQVDVKVE